MRIQELQEQLGADAGLASPVASPAAHGTLEIYGAL